MATYFSQNMVPLQSGCTLNTSVFCAHLWLEFGGKIIAARLVHDIQKKKKKGGGEGPQTTRTVF